MRFLMLVAALAIAPALVADQARPPDWNLQVGLFGYRPDGTVSGTAFESQFPRSSLVYVTESGCGVGAGINPLGQKPFYAWSFTGKVIDMTPEVAVIQLDWQRVMDAGQPATAPSGSEQLTLQAGDRVLLDSIIPHATGTACWSSVAFEARYRSNPFFTDVQLTIRPDGTVRSGGGPLTAASGGGTSTAGAVGGPASSGSAGSGGGSVRSGGATSPDTAANAMPYTVHLWLVRSAPGRPEESQYRQITVSGALTPFAFAPLSIETPQGTTSITVGGSLGVKTGADGDHLLLVMHRNVPNPAGGRTYSESQVKVLPSPEKVMSFEMPPIRLGEQELPGHLSLRLRVDPR